MRTTHPRFKVEESGFIISATYPFIGASPDGVVSCNCHGTGLIEIKCPYSCKEKLPDKDEIPPSHCMDFTDGKWLLKRNHAYYYQVQCQLNVCQLDYCDFIVWTEGQHRVDRILRDSNFFETEMDQVKHFFKYGILPELTGKWLTRAVVSNREGIVPIISNDQDKDAPTDMELENDENRLWCFCEMPSTDELVNCTNKTCPIKKFHMSCLRIRCPPKGKWLCPNCRKLPKFKKGGKKK